MINIFYKLTVKKYTSGIGIMKKTIIIILICLLVILSGLLAVSMIKTRNEYQLNDQINT